MANRTRDFTVLVLLPDYRQACTPPENIFRSYVTVPVGASLLGELQAAALVAKKDAAGVTEGHEDDYEVVSIMASHIQELVFTTADTA